ncbi:MAG: hypothetical protein QNL95_03170, partial [OM182 bacterium]
MSFNYPKNSRPLRPNQAVIPGAAIAAMGASFVINALFSSIALAQETCSDRLDCASSWVGISADERAEVFAFAEDYKDFIAKARTELSFVTEAIAFAEENGFAALTPATRLVPGAKLYEVNRDRT